MSRRVQYTLPIAGQTLICKKAISKLFFFAESFKGTISPNSVGNLYLSDINSQSSILIIFKNTLRQKQASVAHSPLISLVDARLNEVITARRRSQFHRITHYASNQSRI